MRVVNKSAAYSSNNEANCIQVAKITPTQRKEKNKLITRYKKRSQQRSTRRRKKKMTISTSFQTNLITLLVILTAFVATAINVEECKDCVGQNGYGYCESE